MSIVYFCLILLVVALLAWGGKSILYAPGMPIEDPFRKIIWVVFVLLLVFFALQLCFGVLPGMPRLRL